MYKLLIYLDRVSVSNGSQTRCYIFDFKTQEAADEARKFYINCGCNCRWVHDENNND